MTRFARVALLLICVIAGMLVEAEARALPPDPAARGLDVYVHSASKVAPGGSLVLSLRAYGFPAVTQAVALAGATFEVGWDPDAKTTADALPAPLTATADAEGRAIVTVVMPPGTPVALSLLVAVRYGAHARTRVVAIGRTVGASIELLTADTRVVPTSTISAWVHVLGASGEPLVDAPVVVSLLEGGVARHSEKLRTDLGGLVLARVPIPRVSEPSWSWVLHAELEDGAEAGVTLTPREEIPGMATLEAAWIDADGGVAAGARVAYVVRLRDATGQPIRDGQVQIWIGTRGTPVPQSDEAWAKVQRATTDADGEIRAFHDAPTLVKPAGTELQLAVRGMVEGRMLSASKNISVGIATDHASLTGEAAALVPGLTQRVILHVEHGSQEPIASTFAVTGDGLAATVTTDAHGDAELSWAVPIGVGARHNGSDVCAGDVTAAVTIRDTARAARTFAVCMDVERESAGIVRVTPTVVHPGETLHVVFSAPKGPHGITRSVVVKASDTTQSLGGWLVPAADGTWTTDLTVPNDATAGTWDVSIAAAGRPVTTRVVVRPIALPLLTMKRVGGRATPGGAIEVEAELSDGRGHGLAGAVSAVVVDSFGGGRADVSRLDTRARLCAEAGFPNDRCSSALERDVSLLVGKSGLEAVAPAIDPARRADQDFDRAFATVLHALEEAVINATRDPERLVDTRRRENGRWVFNPELLATLSDGTKDRALTPGGEKLTLRDLLAFDPQVTFDNVARRVTRLQIFNLLLAVRQVRTMRGLEADEPIFKDPNALLRRLVRDGTLSDGDLLDPWGGTIQFVKTSAPPILRFVGVVGFELRSPGPDGLVGNADDMRDPFERVLRTGTPYARAMNEDSVVDAKSDLAVSEATVEAWKETLEASTAERSHTVTAPRMRTNATLRQGMADTMGHGSGRGTIGIASGDAFWSRPVRTDQAGKVRFTIPLGAAETTWHIALVGVPDRLLPASADLEVASDLPLSLRADAGARWIAGDVVDTEVLVRNRTEASLAVNVQAHAEGAATLEDGATQNVSVPAKSARTLRLRVRGTAVGEGRLVLTAHADGVPDDVLRHSFEIMPAGETRAITQTAWVDHAESLGVTLEPGYTLRGAPQLVLERGFEDALVAALASLEPDDLTSVHALLDAAEAATRIQRWATTQPSTRDAAIAESARKQADRARGRENVLRTIDVESGTDTGPSGWALRTREHMLTSEASASSVDRCPPDWIAVHEPSANRFRRADDQEILDVEPAEGIDQAPCWGTYVAAASSALLAELDPELVARAINALAERPEHVALTTSLTLHLRQLVKIDRGGELLLPGAAPGDLAARARRATIYAALLHTQHLASSPASAPTLFGKIARLRDARGGYGSSDATLAVVRALLVTQLAGHGASRVHVRGGGIDRVVDVPPSGAVTLALAAETLSVRVEVEGPGLVARLERPVLRSWSHLPLAQTSPVGIETIWPAEARAGSAAILRLVLHQTSTSAGAMVDAQIPLPTGVMLAGPIGSRDTLHVEQLQGVVLVRQLVPTTGSLLEIPIRFGLAGRMSVPEATARLMRSASGTAVAPARELVVR